MKYIKNYSESFQDKLDKMLKKAEEQTIIKKKEYDEELKEEVELYIVDLIDKGFEVECDIDYNKTYDYIDVIIRPPYDNFKPYDEQEFFYWNDIKDQIIVVTKVLGKKYHLSEVGVYLESSTPCILDRDELIDLEDLSVFYTDRELEENTLDKVEIKLVKNK